MFYAIHTDGGARGNPGPAAIGVVIYKIELPWVTRNAESQPISQKGSVVNRFGSVIGSTTNNVAEYTAVIEALKYIIESLKNNTVEGILFYLDSTLVVNQLKGVFKIKEPTLGQLAATVHTLEHSISCPILYQYIPRALNAAPDFEVNKALDLAHVS